MYPGAIYAGRTSQHRKIQLRPSGGGSRIYNVWATVNMPCRRGRYDGDTFEFELPEETHKPISATGQFSILEHYSRDRYGYGYWFSIHGQFRGAYSVSGTLRAGMTDRRYGRCASGDVRYSAHT